MHIDLTHPNEQTYYYTYELVLLCIFFFFWLKTRLFSDPLSFLTKLPTKQNKTGLDKTFFLNF